MSIITFVLNLLQTLHYFVIYYTHAVHLPPQTSDPTVTHLCFLFYPDIINNKTTDYTVAEGRDLVFSNG